MVTTGMTVMMVVHILIVAIMIGLILLQKSEGGALGMGGGSGFMSARGTANFLTRTTGIFATLFFVSTLLLAIMFKGSTETESILDQPVDETTPSVTLPQSTETDTKTAPATSTPKAPGA